MAAICRWHFQIYYLNENVWILIKIPLKFVPEGNKLYHNIGSDNGLAPTRQQAIEPMIIDAYMRHPASMF